MPRRTYPSDVDLNDLHPLLAAAVRVVADASRYNTPTAERTLVKRSLIAELRNALDHEGLGPAWRSEYDRVRRRPGESRTEDV